MEAACLQIQTCNLRQRYDEQAGYTRFRGGAAVNVKIRKNDQFSQGHQPLLGAPHNPDFVVIDQMLAFQGSAVGPPSVPRGDIRSGGAPSAPQCSSDRLGRRGSALSQTARPRLAFCVAYQELINQ